RIGWSAGRHGHCFDMLVYSPLPGDAHVASRNNLEADAGTPFGAYATRPLILDRVKALTAAILGRLEATLPAYMVPSSIMLIDEFPRLSSGKVDRRALATLDSGQTARRQYVPPRTETQRQIARIWQHVLKAELVGATDEFFDLGGHSLL